MLGQRRRRWPNINPALQPDQQTRWTNCGLMLGQRRRRCPTLNRNWFLLWLWGQKQCPFFYYRQTLTQCWPTYYDIGTCPGQRWTSVCPNELGSNHRARTWFFVLVYHPAPIYNCGLVHVHSSSRASAPLTRNNGPSALVAWQAKPSK